MPYSPNYEAKQKLFELLSKDFIVRKGEIEYKISSIQQDFFVDVESIEQLETLCKKLKSNRDFQEVRFILPELKIKIKT